MMNEQDQWYNIKTMEDHIEIRKGWVNQRLMRNHWLGHGKRFTTRSSESHMRDH